MTAAEVDVRQRGRPKHGQARPRIAPPTPVHSEWREFHDLARRIGIDPYPWQDTASRYVCAIGPAGKWLYPEVAVIVGRQSGKTTLLPPLIMGRLLDGRKIMHTAQNRELPRETHDQVATLLTQHFPHELPDKRGIRYGAGQEEIRLRNGGRYRIVAPTRGGARGPANDDVIVDELREMETNEFIAAAEPTLSAAPNPQIIYLSNAGTEDSIVLNALKRRADADPSLAYLEWSAAPERSADDEDGWLEANPDIGHNPGKLAYLRRKYESYRLAGSLSIFETEHLCRWVVTMRERLVDEVSWALCRGDPGEPRMPFMGISMDPSGTRASAAIAWRRDDGSFGLRSVFEATGSPIDVTALGEHWRETALRMGVAKVGMDPLTDGELARYFKKVDKVSGQGFANATSTFVTAVEGHRLAWDDAPHVTEDLVWTARKSNDERGSFEAVRASDDRPITAALAAIRAVWLASIPPMGPARIY